MTESYKKEKNWILQEKHSGHESEAYFADLKRLSDGEPIDYIIGNRPFLDCTIDLSFRPLIPRNETEYWTKGVIEDLKKENQKTVLQVLDIFSGSGCIGIAILKHIKNACVTFVDKSPEAIKQIQKNLSLHDISTDRSDIYKSDFFDSLPETEYDLILANPPYIPKENMEKLPPSVRDFEPREALDGGDDGLLLIRKFLKHAGSYLKQGGKIIIEFDSEQKETLEAMMKEEPHFDFHFETDQYGRFRTLHMKKK